MKVSYLRFAVLVRIFIVITIAIAASFMSSAQLVGAQSARGRHNIYLPHVVSGGSGSSASGFSTSSKWIGIYMQKYWTSSSVSTYMTQADQLAGKKHSVSGWFIDIQDPHFSKPPSDIKTNNLYQQLESLWSKGYVSFVNINSNATSYAIASGQYDSNLREMAQVYAAWIRLGGGRIAYLAPLPEMNGDWASYGGDPSNFKLAYKHIMDVFAQQGVARANAWWVFAPNGWTLSGGEFEKYYPGASTVDVVGFSSYNYGYCQVAIPWQRWENYDTLYAPYLARIAKMAPNKPIIIAQTGTTAEYQSTGGINVSAKNTWLRTNYEYLAKQPQVFGVIYYDINQSSWECNWEITTGGNYSGYTNGVAAPAFHYLSAQDMKSVIP